MVAITQMLLQTGVALGIDRAELLAVAQLDEGDVADRDAYIPLAKQLAIGAEISRRLPGCNIGLAALQHLQPASFGVLGYVICHSERLRAALEAFVRYQNLLSDAIAWRLESDATTTTITIDVASGLEKLAHPVETQVGVWVAIGRRLTGAAWSPSLVAFRHQPIGDPGEHEAFFACPVRFGAAANQLELANEILALPIHGARPELRPSLAFLLQTLLDDIAEPSPGEYTRRVSELLRRELPKGVTTKHETARALATSERTLSRRLRAEGTSFREILDDQRRLLSQAWLSDPNNAVYEVAYLLGYTETSAFHRSFRRWTGYTPAEWRQRQSASRGNEPRTPDVASEPGAA